MAEAHHLASSTDMAMFIRQAQASSCALPFG